MLGNHYINSSYDAMFLKGLQEGGVPIKFSSWHTFIFSTGAAANVNLMVQERSRSVKSLFAVQRRAPASYSSDSGALFYETGISSVLGNTLQNYQYRIGGRYFPAAPVQCSFVGGNVSNGGAEAFMELQKALNVVGDYRLSSNCNVLKWAIPGNLNTSIFPENDYAYGIASFDGVGHPVYTSALEVAAATTGSAAAGNAASACFAMAVDLETSNGVEISGLNAEEQSDIALIANWNAPQQGSFLLEVYSYYDAMIILRENNVLELIQ